MTVGELEDEKQKVGQAGRGEPSVGHSNSTSLDVGWGAGVEGEAGLRQSPTSISLCKLKVTQRPTPYSSKCLGRTYVHYILLPHSDVTLIPLL